jgi:hypothetical protein
MFWDKSSFGEIPMTIVIIAGGRDYRPTQDSFSWLNALHGRLTIDGVVSGGATGADRFGEDWARVLNIPLKIMKAEWHNYGFQAGPIRNQQMADFLLLYHQRAVLLFPGGRGTASMRNIAKTSGIAVYDFPSLTPSP